MDSSAFYANLPLIDEFRDVGRQESYTPLPDDWHVVMCDVRNSTEAVQAGQYKKVNTLGAALITAVLNLAAKTEIPFIFEGDGATLCVPPGLIDGARAALLQTQALAQRSFGLDLRVATMPVSRIREDPATAHLYRVEPGSIAANASFEGLECRWQDIPSRHGETVSVMVRILLSDAAQVERLYLELIAKVREIYGADDDCHPVWPPNLAFSFSRSRLDSEVGVRAGQRGAPGRWRYLMRTRLIVLLGGFLMTFRIRTAETDWDSYKTILARNSDVKKFNDRFRQILAGTASQRETLTKWLDERFARRELVYGIHVANRAQITCLVFDYSGRHVHFVDGADGGLFMAAKALKERART